MKYIILVVAACMLALAVPLRAQTAPEQLHLAFRGLGGSCDMVVSWLTRNATATSTVRYGTSAAALSSSATGSARSYHVSFSHDVVLEGLKCSTMYFYQCGDATGGWSPTYNFTTQMADPTSAADAVKPWTVALFGDMGVTNSENTTARLTANRDQYDWIVHNGDFGYADDRLSEKDFESIWNSWANSVQPFAGVKPYMVTPGNHEAACHSFGDIFCDTWADNFTAYNHRFRMPSAESGGTENMWHSFDYGNAHFVMIDTETDITDAPEGPHTLWKAGGFGDQLSWLKADLEKAKANRAVRPWIIVVGHRPMYTSSKAGGEAIVWPNVTEHLRGDIEGLLHDADVDLYIGAHVHGYERTWPVYNNQTTQKHYMNPPSLTHMVVGMAGNIEGHQGNGHWSPWTPDWLATRDGEHFGYVLMTVQNASHLTWRFHDAATDSVMDEIVLVRERK